MTEPIENKALLLSMQAIKRFFFRILIPLKMFMLSGVITEIFFDYNYDSKIKAREVKIF